MSDKEESKPWVLRSVEPGQKIQEKELHGGYYRACQEAKNLRYRKRTTPIRIWIMREF